VTVNSLWWLGAGYACGILATPATSAAANGPTKVRLGSVQVERSADVRSTCTILVQLSESAETLHSHVTKRRSLTSWHGIQYIERGHALG
jgi:hypothetical protein